MIAIAGGTGRIGRRLLVKLAKGKTKAIAIVRSRESAKKLPKGVRFKVASFETGENLPEALKGAKTVVNLMGSTDTTLSEHELIRANTLATAHLFAALPETVENVVHISSVTVYGKRLAKIPADESCPPNPDTVYSKTKFAGEKIAEQNSHRAKVTILRPSIIYGPEFEMGFFPMLKSLENGSARLFGEGKNHIPLLHVDDLANAIILACTRPRPAMAIYNIAPEQNNTPTQKETFEIAAKLLGANPPSKTINPTVAKLAVKLSSLFGVRKGITTDMVGQLAADRVFDVSLAQKELGWKPKIGLKEGFEQVVKRYKEVMKHGKNKRLHS